MTTDQIWRVVDGLQHQQQQLTARITELEKQLKDITEKTSPKRTNQNDSL